MTVLPDDVVAAMRRPEGTVQFCAVIPGLHDPEPNLLLNIVTGAHVFRVVRENAERLTAFHASPGGGTWTACVDLRSLVPHESVEFWIAWSPESLFFLVGDRAQRKQCVQAGGALSPVDLWVAEDGTVVEVAAANVMAARVVSAGRTVASPPAIKLWGDTLEAVRVLLGGESSEGFMFESVMAIAALTMLVTGLETYCEGRFRELDSEGIPCDVAAVLRRLGTAEEREAIKAGKLPKLLFDEPPDGAVNALARRRLSFQSFDTCKKAFRFGYGVVFGRDLGVPSQLLRDVRRTITYRNRAVHVSPLLGVLNSSEVPPEEPVFANLAFAEKTRSTLDEFIHALHRATLSLRP